LFKRRDIKKDIADSAGPLIKILKNVYHSAESSANVTFEELKKHRNFIESVAHIAFTHTRLKIKKFDIGNIEAEWIMPFYNSPDKKIIFYCHGGGYTCGELEYAGILGTKMTAHTGFPVLTFAYRLAPENRYPAALEDTVRVWEYLLSTGLKASDVIVAGDSAGGNLALELCLYLKKIRSSLPSALILFSPWTDMTANSYTYETEEANDPIISKIYVRNARKAYLGENVTDYKNPDYSPVYAQLSGLPPTLIQVGRNEVLRHDSELLAVKLKKSGVRVKLQIYNGGWHVFQQFPTLMAKRAMMEVHMFLISVIYGRKVKK
jgi:monoterpene epsilon-lactone hydrolase